MLADVGTSGSGLNQAHTTGGVAAPPVTSATSSAKIGTGSSGRYATTIYKCQVCTKAFATLAFLEEHMKLVHAAESSIKTLKLSPPGGATVNNIAFTIETNQTNNAIAASSSIECSSCHKILPNKEALKSHFQVKCKKCFESPKITFFSNSF